MDLFKEEKLNRVFVLIGTLSLLTGCMTLGGADSSDLSSAGAERYVTASPEEAKIISSDIDRFWRAYDAAYPEDMLETYRNEYLQRGSTGLREFTRLKIGNADNLVMNVWNHSRYYASVRSSTRSIRTQDDRIRESYRKLRDLYPDALFPNLYFLIGAMNSGGISTNYGLVIGVELFSKTESSPLDELNPWEKSVVQPIDKIPLVVAHELAHFQQRFGKETETLLERSIAEGEADFISELIAGGQINELQHRYGDEHELLVWNEFQEVMHGRDFSRWLYNGSALAAKGQLFSRPADLGYYIGYKICQSYYHNASDKRKAIRDMLEIDDFDKFLRESGYGSRFASNAESGTPSGSGLKKLNGNTSDAGNSGSAIAASQKTGVAIPGH